MNLLSWRPSRWGNMTHTCQWTGSTLVQVMPHCLFKFQAINWTFFDLLKIGLLTHWTRQNGRYIFAIYIITLTPQWARWRLKSPASPLYTQPFIQAHIKENTKARVTGLCAGNSPVTGEFPAQMASNAKNVSIWWYHPDRKFSYFDSYLNGDWIQGTN